MNEKFEKLLTAKQVAEILSLNESTIYKWVDQKRLSYIDLGKDGVGKRCLRFRKEDLQKLIEEKFVRSN